MICQECGMEIEGNEYHPYGLCVLYKAGINPLTFVLEAVRKLIGSEETNHIPCLADIPFADDIVEIMEQSDD